MRRAQANEPAKIWIAENGAIRIRSPWQASFVHELKQLPSSKRHWMPSLRVWEVEYELLDKVVALAKQYFPEVIVVEQATRSSAAGQNGHGDPWSRLLILLSTSDLLAIHKLLVKRYHPDTGNGDESKMAQINAVFEGLK